jgi:protein TonB
VRVSNPGYAGTCKLAYSKRAERRQMEGTVVVHVLIGPDGKPLEVNVARSSGHDELDRIAREGIAECAFIPQKVGGVAVRAIAEIPVPFSLKTR